MSGLPLWAILLGSNVLAALVAAGTTLFGIRRQLRHDAAERSLERKVSIILAAAESFAKMQAYLASFTQFDSTQATRHALLDGCWGPFNKALMIANQNSLEAILKLHEIWALATVELEAERGFVDFKEKNLIQLRDKLEFEKEALLRSVRDPETTAEQDSRDDNEFERLKNEGERAIEIQDALTKRRVELNRLVQRHSSEFEKHAALANVAIRKEVGYDLDEKRYLELVNKSSESILAKLNNTIDEIVQFNEKGNPGSGAS
jgi:hypothetical protein